MVSSPQENRDFWTMLAVAAIVGALLFLLMPIPQMLRAENDFVVWYTGAKLFGTPDLHIQKANQDLQLKYLGRVFEHSYFIRPTFYGLLLKPLSWMPYLPAYVVFQVFSVGVCLLYFLRTYARQWKDIYVFAVMSVPVISNIVNGHDVTLLLAFCTASLMLARKNRDFLAGLVFALCAIKFHLFILTPVAMLAHKRWRIFWGAVVGEFGLFLLGLTGGGWSVFLSWIALLRNQENHPYPELMPNLRGMVFALTGGPGGTGLMILLSLLVVGVVIFLAIRAESYEKAFAYTLMGGLIVNYHAYIQDPMLLLLVSAILFDGTESRGFRVTMQLLLFPVAYILLMWRPPFSATYTILVLVALGFAFRDKLRDPSSSLRRAAN